jgi:hypothetical protein
MIKRKKLKKMKYKYFTYTRVVLRVLVCLSSIQEKKNREIEQRRMYNEIWYVLRGERKTGNGIIR